MVQQEVWVLLVQKHKGNVLFLVPQVLVWPSLQVVLEEVVAAGILGVVVAVLVVGRVVVLQVEAVYQTAVKAAAAVARTTSMARRTPRPSMLLGILRHLAGRRPATAKGIMAETALW
jgi:hypothetical protein